MKKFILGTKVGMTQIFAEDGVCTPVTVVQAGPCMVVQKKTVDTDSYDAVRVGYGEVDKQKLNKPDRGLFDKLDMSRISNLLQMVASNDFGQIFITDSNKVRMSGIVDKLTQDRAYFETVSGTFSRI